MYCGECGTKNEKDAKFCENCGAALEQEEKKEGKREKKSAAKARKPISKSKKILIGVICLIVGFWHDFKDLTVIQKTGIILCVIGYVVPVVLSQVMRIFHLE